MTEETPPEAARRSFPPRAANRGRLVFKWSAALIVGAIFGFMLVLISPIFVVSISVSIALSSIRTIRDYLKQQRSKSHGEGLLSFVARLTEKSR